MRSLIIDIECDGLDPTVIWCIVCKDIETEAVFQWGPGCIDGEVKDFKAWALEEAGILIGHNLICFDVPILARLLDYHVPLKNIVDTLVVSKVLDSSHKRHSLEAWGERLGYPKVEHDEWGFYSPEMLHRCTEDVHLNHKLYKVLIKNWAKFKVPKEVSRTEHRVAELCYQIQTNGWAFNERKAHDLLVTLSQRKAQLDSELLGVFVSLPAFEREVEPKYKADGTLSKVGLKYLDDHWTNVVGNFSKVTWPEPNFNSNPFIIRHLQRMGWVPKQFTNKGNPQLTEWVMEEIGKTIPEAAVLVEWDMVDRRIAMLQNWIGASRKDGRIGSKVWPIGTWTHRASHSNPNQAQVPANDKEYGREMRGLWRSADGYVLLGCDASGIQLRVLANYMGDSDYAQEVAHGDVHTRHLEVIGIGTRDNAKTFLYAFLLGAGGARLGAIYGKGQKFGNQLKYNFLNKIEALGRCKRKWEKISKKGYIKGLDGRIVPVSDSYYVLAALLQNGETVIMRRAMILLADRSKHLDWKLVGWIHDEIQMEVLPEHAEELGKICKQSIIDAGTQLNLKCDLDAEYKIGQSWADTH